MFKRLLSFFIIFFLAFLFIKQDANALGAPVKVSNSSNDVAFPQTITDSKGYLHSVWMELNPGQTVFLGVNPGIFYSRWNGDTWSTPLKISSNTDFAANPSISVDSTDTVHVAWEDNTNGNCADLNPPPCQPGSSMPIVVYNTRSSSGTWAGVTTIAPPAGTLATRNARVAVNSANEPNIFFDATNGYTDSIYWTRFTAGAWTTPVLISLNEAGAAITDSQWVDVKNDNAGNIHLVYWSWTQSLHYRKLTNNVFSTPFKVNDSGNMESTKLGATPAGEVFITWYQVYDTSVNVRWTQGGVWQLPVALTTSAQRSHWGYPIMGVTTDSKERAHVGWGEYDTNDGLVDLKYRSFVTGTWSAAQDVDLNNNNADTPFVYPDIWDNQHFMWAEKNPSTNVWELMYRVNEGTVQTVPTTGGTITANPFNINQLTLTVPSGALAAATQIGIQVGPVPESVSPTQVTIPKAYTFRPDGQTFLTPVTARIFYTNAEVAGADEAQLKPWVWDSLTSTWTAQTVTSRSTGQNWMEVSLSHFSLYGISAPRIVVEWEKPTKEVKKDSLKYSFEMKYASGDNIILANDPQALKVILKNSEGNILQTQLLGKKGVEQHGKDKFEGKMNIKNYPSGNYTLEVLLNDSFMSSRPVELK